MVTLTGVATPSFNRSDITPRYQFSIYTDRLEFLETSDWINDLGSYLVCFYDVHITRESEIESRVVVFTSRVVVEFLFELVHNTSEGSDRNPIHAPSYNNLLSMLRNYN